jgi:mono/diheme cytochrome c family protein
MKTMPASLKGLTLVLSATALFALGVSLSSAQARKPAQRKGDQRPQNAISTVPAKALARHDPLENDPDAAAAGEKLFEQHCAECHGSSAEGSRRGPSLLTETVHNAGAGALFWILTNGVIRHGMPDWSKLPEAERWQIVTFVRSFKAQVTSRTSP